MQYRAAGTPLSMAGASSDISQRTFAEEHREVLVRELTHRVKNSLATVNAIVSQTLRDASSLEEATTTVSGRIASLGAAQELLIQGEVEGASVDQIVDGALLPLKDKEGIRFSVEGPSIRLSPEITPAPAMVYFTNWPPTPSNVARSPCRRSGRLPVVDWHQEGERRLRFTWTEQEGPPVTPPTRTGFGTRMILRMLRQHVRGEAAIRYLETGATFEIELAL